MSRVYQTQGLGGLGVVTHLDGDAGFAGEPCEDRFGEQLVVGTIDDQGSDVGRDDDPSVVGAADGVQPPPARAHHEQQDPSRRAGRDPGDGEELGGPTGHFLGASSELAGELAGAVSSRAWKYFLMPSMYPLGISSLSIASLTPCLIALTLFL
ncbi:MAG: hypothetical protein Ct9H300mP1_37330 [Planctomycetaceae bacterium]|nr:MAG: hypothetical protein Ct9H300mP1_37330 [Planctomycetaceae bacterium]